MEKLAKFITDEKTGITYELQGDYYIPCLKFPREEQVEIGVWGQRHLRYIKKHCKPFYSKKPTESTLYDYLLQLNCDAEDTFNRLINQMAELEGVTEQLKSNEMV